jgi:hypothetical protein
MVGAEKKTSSPDSLPEKLYQKGPLSHNTKQKLSLLVPSKLG